MQKQKFVGLNFDQFASMMLVRTCKKYDDCANCKQYKNIYYDSLQQPFNSYLVYTPFLYTQYYDAYPVTCLHAVIIAYKLILESMAILADSSIKIYNDDEDWDIEAEPFRNAAKVFMADNYGKWSERLEQSINSKNVLEFINVFEDRILWCLSCLECVFPEKNATREMVIKTYNKHKCKLSLSIIEANPYRCEFEKLLYEKLIVEIDAFNKRRKSMESEWLTSNDRFIL
jgi:hypothetical protein